MANVIRACSNLQISNKKGYDKLLTWSRFQLNSSENLHVMFLNTSNQNFKTWLLRLTETNLPNKQISCLFIFATILRTKVMDAIIYICQHVISQIFALQQVYCNPPVFFSPLWEKICAQKKVINDRKDSFAYLFSLFAHLNIHI